MDYMDLAQCRGMQTVPQQILPRLKRSVTPQDCVLDNLMYSLHEPRGLRLGVLKL